MTTLETLPSADELFASYERTYGAVRWPIVSREPTPVEHERLTAQYEKLISDPWLIGVLKTARDRDHQMSLLRARWYSWVVSSRTFMGDDPSLFIGAGEFFEYYEEMFGGPLVPISDCQVSETQMDHLYRIYWRIVNDPVNIGVLRVTDSREQLKRMLAELWAGTIIKLANERCTFGGLLTEVRNERELP